MSIVLRSLLFNALFYLNTTLHCIAVIPALLMPARAIILLAKLWAHVNLWLLRWTCSIEAEWRGDEKIPSGPLIVACKHQSVWETFALLTWFDDPTFIVKRELMWIPLFGWAMWKTGMISVDRGAGSQALAEMTMRTKEEITRGKGRQVIIFPEGTRRPAGAEPKYKFGVAHLYEACGVPCLPLALNSGLFWPRRSFLRYPGTIVAEALDPIAPGLDKSKFFERVRNETEAATARLVEEGRRQLGVSS